MSQNQFPQRKKNTLDVFAFNLRAPVPNEKGKFSNLIWETSRNSLGMKVYTSYPDDQMNQNGLIRARLEGIAFYTFLEMIQTALSATGEWKGKIEYTDYTFFGGKRSDAPVTQSVIFVGRTEEGAIWVSVIDAVKKDRPRIQFFFGAGRNYKFKHGDGTDYTLAETSQLAARAYYNFLSNAGSQVMVNEYVEPKKKENNNYRNNNNNSGGGYNNNNTVEDDDIPF